MTKLEGWLPVVNITYQIARKPTPDDPLVGIPKGIMIHHEGSSYPEGSSAAAIAHYHVHTLEWPRIAYHFIIERDGRIEQTLDIGEQGPHCGYSTTYGDNIALAPQGDPQYYNKHYLAVCIVGNDPTPSQTESLAALITALRIAIPTPFQILRHLDAPGKATACPGKKINLSELEDLVAEKLAFRTGDPFFDQFPDWRTRAINAKGVADQAIDVLREVRNELETQINAILVLQESIRRTIEKANTIVGA